MEGTETQQVFFRKHKKAIEWHWGLANFKEFISRFLKRANDEEQWTFDYESYVISLNEKEYEHPMIWAAEYYGKDWDEKKLKEGIESLKKTLHNGKHL